MAAWQTSGVAASEPGQETLHFSTDEGATQPFVLRYIFHHDLKKPDHQPATFVNIAVPEINVLKQARTLNSTKSIKLRYAKTQYTSNGKAGQRDTRIEQTIYPVPVVTDKDTVVNLATMTSDVYYFNASNPGWLNLTQGFTDSSSFGYESDGLHGHIFSNLDNSTVIVAFKGSSVDPRDKTHTKDRLNDNVLFSCCCATQRPDPYWYGEVCSCRQDVYKCNDTCLVHEITQKDRYYAAASSVMYNITQDIFPSVSVWATGHSLGGSLASLMGLKFSIPAITFEAPPDRLPARRLGLVPSKTELSLSPPIYHFGNTADPIYMGACNGLLSTCAAAGYSFESQCFTGKRCIYDTVGDKGWRMNIANHRINTVIADVLQAYDTVPDCLDEEDECTDCFNWSYN